MAPIVQSTTYVYESSKEMGDLFDLQAEGFFYTRLANPTLDAVEKKIAALEGGRGRHAHLSGQAANLMAVLNICPAGFHVVSSSAIYPGGTGADLSLKDLSLIPYIRTLHESGVLSFKI